jgi:hypothetical protein
VRTRQFKIIKDISYTSIILNLKKKHLLHLRICLLQGALPPGPQPWLYPGPTGGFKTAPDSPAYYSALLLWNSWIRHWFGSIDIVQIKVFLKLGKKSRSLGQKFWYQKKDLFIMHLYLKVQ